MTSDVQVQAFQAGGDLELSTESTVDEAQVSGRWIRAGKFVEAWR